MARELTGEQKTEFDRRVALIRLFAEFVETRQLFTGESLRAFLSGWGTTLEALETQRNLENLLVLREAGREIRGFMKEIPQKEAGEFWEAVERTAGMDLEAERSAEVDLLEEILARGRIESEYELRLVEYQVEERIADGEETRETERLLRLVDAYSPPESSETS